MLLTARMSSGVSLHGVGDGILKSSELFPPSNFMLVGPGKLYTFLGSSSCYQKIVPLYINANKERRLPVTRKLFLFILMQTRNQE